ncbi:two-component system sensor histidine kinase YesM [Paenibacillus anaericanus]|uniref:cache domain-containing sensor histidine kinase n=1 Tax=Paenibacillus anaericanus TaxID=170367 RepID=UPI00277D5DE8|nr:sensor histidine kinase [Paenibacillus anaericanus]MDQ0087336.1 two-component system sensor histidine kinase YesM [Paenibacillus anaericanus]
MALFKQFAPRRRWRIAQILNISFFLMISLPLFLVTLYSVRSFNSILVKNTTSQALQTLEQVSYTFQSEAQMIMNTLSTMGNDDELIATASAVSSAENSQEHLQMSKKLDTQVGSYFHYTGDVASVLFFFKDQKMYEYKRSLGQNASFYHNQEWYKSVSASKNRVELMGIEHSTPSVPEDGMYITAAISPKYSPIFYDVDMIYLVFRASKFIQLLETKNSGAGDIYVVGEGGDLIASTNNDALREGMEGVQYSFLDAAKQGTHGSYVHQVDGKESYIVYTEGDLGWKFIQVVPYEGIMAQVTSVFHRTILVSAIGLIIFLLMSYFFVRSIVKPIVALFRQMAQVKSGNLSVSITPSGPLEIYVLGNAFNEMMLNMEGLLHEVKEKERQKRIAEITALQSQINPHFLLNTLNTIKLMASISKVSNIQRMTEALTKLLSSAFNQGGMYSTIGEEMVLLDYYVQIMKIRYGDLFDMECVIDPALEQALIPKLMLQPIVENAIIHGMHEKESRGKIVITGGIVDKEACLFTIHDDGVGMSLEALSELREGHETNRERFNGIGLRNVQDRISLNYGSNYGMVIESNQEQGTTVTLRIPLMYHTDSK